MLTPDHFIEKVEVELSLSAASYKSIASIENVFQINDMAAF